MIPPFVFHFSNICHVTTRKLNRAYGNNTEYLGKIRFNGRAVPTGVGKSMCYVPPFCTRYYIIFFLLMVICNSLLLLKSLPINIINCIKFYVNCSALTGVYDWQYKYLYVCFSPTLGQHISTFRGYRIVFSIRNPYINRFTNHFSIHS
jgi:hypothetical protein